jgi:hypothetical protein
MSVKTRYALLAFWGYAVYPQLVKYYSFYIINDITFIFWFSVLLYSFCSLDDCELSLRTYNIRKSRITENVIECEIVCINKGSK